MEDHSATTSPAFQLETLRLSATDSIRAVHLQVARMRSGDLVAQAFDDESSQREADVRFLIVAIRWLHRACAGAAQLAGDERLTKAVADFESAVFKGSLKEMRDIYEHLDEYIVGAGRLQHPKRRQDRVADLVTLFSYTWTGSPGTLGSLAWAGLQLNFDTAVVQAGRLYAAMRDTDHLPVGSPVQA